MPTKFRAALSRASGPLATVVLSILALAQAVRLWEWRPGTPLGRLGDAPWTATLVRTYIDHGPYADNPLFGAPFALNTGWASTVDDIHIWALTAMGLFTSDPFTVMALYFFICFPLSALAMYWMCRKYGLAKPASVVAGVLFSVVPGHQDRFAHLFLAGYWAVPFAIYLIIETARGRSVFPPLAALRSGSWRFRLRSLAPPVVMLVLLGLGDVYYVAFTVLLLVAVVVVRQFLQLNVREVAKAAVPALVMVVPTVASLAFARVRASRDEVTGGMAFARSVADSDRWSGRLMDLILPWDGHRVGLFGQITDSYNVLTDRQGETSALGIVALVGVVGVLGVAGAAALKGRTVKRGPLLTAMAVVTLLAIGFYTTGGLGSWFALFFTPQIRTWSRLFLFIAAIGFVGVALWLTKVGRRRGRLVAWPLALVVLVVGVWDQTSPGRAPDYAEQRAHLTELQHFDDQVEQTLGAGCPVFVLPVVQFPEVFDDSVAELLSLGLASHDLRWSFGGIKGTAQADWQLALPTTDGADLADDLSAVGFCGAVVHDSLDEKSPELASGIKSQWGTPVASTPSGSLVAYDLRGWREALLAEGGAGAVSQRKGGVLRPVVVSLQGVWREDSSDPVRYPMGPTPTLELSNLSTGPVEMDVSVSIVGGRDAEQTFTMTGLGAPPSVAKLAPGAAGTLSTRVVVPPGQSTLKITTDGALDDLARYQNRERLAYIADVTATSSDPDVNVGVNLPQP